ncbi:DUF2878 family protein [Ferrimonas futtsuensis]|uniref:DUF2878 family protein n=1 Tax=Ferrimonas futtsuensis TaxID=364764 RepID=UPI000687A741|nr:DUF2878 family protein [Ferrimonas futtsuensis]
MMNGTPFARPKLSPQTRQLLLDSAVFQLFWIGSVATPHIVMQLVALGLWALASPWPWRLWLLSLMTALLGSAVDALWIQAGLFTPHDPLPGLFIVPLWLMLLWLACARYLLMLVNCLALPAYGLFLLGATTGPLSYVAAAALGAATLAPPSISLWTMFALWWGLLMLMIKFIGSKS